MSEKKPKVLHKSDGWYIFSRGPGGELWLDVMVGTIALYTRRWTLDEKETKEYEARGTAYLDELSRDIVKNEPKYREQGRTVVV